MNINIPAFIDSLKYMAQGMIGIFIVTGIIVLLVLLLNKLSSTSNKKDNNQQ